MLCWTSDGKSTTEKQQTGWKELANGPHNPISLSLPLARASLSRRGRRTVQETAEASALHPAAPHSAGVTNCVAHPVYLQQVPERFQEAAGTDSHRHRCAGRCSRLSWFGVFTLCGRQSVQNIKLVAEMLLSVSRGKVISGTISWDSRTSVGKRFWSTPPPLPKTYEPVFCVSDLVTVDRGGDLLSRGENTALCPPAVVSQVWHASSVEEWIPPNQRGGRKQERNIDMMYSCTICKSTALSRTLNSSRRGLMWCSLVQTRDGAACVLTMYSVMQRKR